MQKHIWHRLELVREYIKIGYFPKIEIVLTFRGQVVGLAEKKDWALKTTKLLQNVILHVPFLSVIYYKK